jgi:hypothetical protein
MNWRMVELYVKISSIGNAGDSLNNLSESSNRTENIIPSTTNLAHQIHESDPQRFVNPTTVSCVDLFVDSIYTVPQTSN